MILSHYQASALLQARKSGEAEATTTADFGLSTVTVTLTNAGVVYPADMISWALLEDIAADSNGCFVIEADGARKVQAFSEVTNRACSLYPTPGPPTLLVGGFPMHRIKNTDPGKDTRSKIKALGKVSGRVLDTNTGLGYTAIALSQYAEHVTTVELDPAVIEVASDNPHSRALFDNVNITQVMGDSFDVVEDQADESFDRVLHDPPTYQLAGHLYSREFYEDVWRILKRGGRMFHYIGDPDSKQGARVTRGVVQRLGEAGFKRVQPRPRAYGVVAFK